MSEILHHNKDEKIKIYACHHKPYFTLSNSIIEPIHVGAALSDYTLDMQKDNTLDNISHKNPYYCELTATYWIWKNATADIVGLCHYRRFFNFKNDEIKVQKLTDTFLADYGVNADNIIRLLNEYDIILPRKNKVKSNEPTLYDYYAREHIINDLDVTIDVLKSKHPEQAALIDKVLKENTQGYFANMIIAKRNIFNKYAQWLFDVLFAVEERIQPDVLTRDAYQQRVYGFLAERLMTVFVALNPDLKIKELPKLYVEDNPKIWRRYKMRRIKHKIFEFLHLRKKDEN